MALDQCGKRDLLVSRRNALEKSAVIQADDCAFLKEPVDFAGVSPIVPHRLALGSAQCFLVTALLLHVLAHTAR